MDLTDTFQSPEQLDYLASRNIFADESAFFDALRAPADGRLSKLLGFKSGTASVFMGQQLYVDYHASVIAKFDALQRIAEYPGVKPFLWWMDTDRCGSDKLGSGFIWKMRGKEIFLRMISAKSRQIETRFAKVDTEVVKENLQRFLQYLRVTSTSKAEGLHALQQWKQLETLALGREYKSAADLNMAITDWLLDSPVPSIRVSDVLVGDLITASIDTFLERIDDVVRTVNSEINKLATLGINPQIRPLRDDYLPLNITCPNNATRLRLRRAGDRAVASCKCGKTHSFALRGGELYETGRWSPDVCLPIFANHLIGGIIGGKSSALYGAVLNAVTADVFEQRAAPVLIPPELRHPCNETGSLLQRKFTLPK